jgi:hypothetical protein
LCFGMAVQAHCEELVVFCARKSLQIRSWSRMTLRLGSGEPIALTTPRCSTCEVGVLASLEDLKNVQENQGRAEGSKKSEKGSKEDEKVR